MEQMAGQLKVGKRFALLFGAMFILVVAVLLRVEYLFYMSFALAVTPGVAWLLRSEQATPALPPSAVERLRAVVERSRASVRATVREAVAAGELRDDVPISVLVLSFVATVHALVGQPGLSGRTRPGLSVSSGLDGWFRMAAPP